MPPPIFERDPGTDGRINAARAAAAAAAATAPGATGEKPNHPEVEVEVPQAEPGPVAASSAAAEEVASGKVNIVGQGCQMGV